MKARIKYVENACFVGESGSGHAIIIDGPESIGGRNLGVRPMELMLMSVGACSAVDVIYILRKSRQPVADCYVEVSGERAETEPKVFTAIHLNFVVIGDGLSEKHVQRAVELSAEKYCSASIMLGKAADISHSYEVRSSVEGSD